MKQTPIQMLINMVINVLWTLLAFTPVVLFWVYSGVDILFWLFLLVSVIPVVIKPFFFNFFQIEWNTKFYKNIGIVTFQRLTQNGSIAKKLADQLSQGNSRFNKMDVTNLQNEIVGYEKYHYCCLLFFTFTFIWSFLLGRYLVSLFIILANIIYNVIPILIQQYNKARLRNVIMFLQK